MSQRLETITVYIDSKNNCYKRLTIFYNLPWNIRVKIKWIRQHISYSFLGESIWNGGQIQRVLKGNNMQIITGLFRSFDLCFNHWYYTDSVFFTKRPNIRIVLLCFLPCLYRSCFFFKCINVLGITLQLIFYIYMYMIFFFCNCKNRSSLASRTSNA